MNDSYTSDLTNATNTNDTEEYDSYYDDSFDIFDLFGGGGNDSGPSIRDQVKKIAKDKFIERCKTDPMPTARDIISSFDILSTVLHVCLIFMAAISLALFIEEVIYMKAHIKLSYRRRLSILQAGIAPVFMISSVVGCFFPGGHIMIDFVTSVYFGIGLHAFLLLMVNYYGGLSQMVLKFEGKFLNMNTGPFCCCLCCLPTFRMTRPNFKKIWYATFQAALLRPIILFFEGVFTTDETIPIPKILYSALLIPSMLTGMWALVIFRRASQEMLSQYRVTAKFFNFQAVLLMANVQPFIIKVIYIPCSPPYTFYARKVVVNYQIYVLEFFLLSLITRCLYRRSTDNEELPTIEKTSSLLPIEATSAETSDLTNHMQNGQTTMTELTEINGVQPYNDVVNGDMV